MNGTEFPFLRRRRRRLPLVNFTERDAAHRKEDLIDIYSGWNCRSYYTNDGGWFFWTETIPTQVCRFLIQEVHDNNVLTLVLDLYVAEMKWKDILKVGCLQGSDLDKGPCWTRPSDYYSHSVFGSNYVITSYSTVALLQNIQLWKYM